MSCVLCSASRWSACASRRNCMPTESPAPCSESDTTSHSGWILPSNPNGATHGLSSSMRTDSRTALLSLCASSPPSAFGRLNMPAVWGAQARNGPPELCHAAQPSVEIVEYERARTRCPKSTPDKFIGRGEVTDGCCCCCPLIERHHVCHPARRRRDHQLVRQHHAALSTAGRSAPSSFR